MTEVRLFHSQDLDNHRFPPTEEGRYAREFLKAFMEDRPKKYIANIETTVSCLQIDQYFLPITINDTEYDNSYVISPYGVIPYAQEELKRLNHRLLTPTLLPVIKGVGQTLKWGKVNRIVTVNNWLFSTNLYPSLSKEQIVKVVALLQEKFPSHAILWRSLNTTHPTQLLDTFQQQLPCRLICNRQVYFFNPFTEHQLNAKQRWNIKNDHNLMKIHGYHPVKGSDLTDQDIPRIRKLYDALYLEKYTPLNPQFTDEFIRLALEKRLLNILALSKEGTIDAVIGYFVRGNVMTTPLFGYDTTLPQKMGLYRMLTALSIQQACQLKLYLHHSSGASHFKRVRGMRADLEYAAVFDRHLPRRHRLAWSLLAALLNRVGRPMLTHFKL